MAAGAATGPAPAILPHPSPPGRGAATGREHGPRDEPRQARTSTVTVRRPGRSPHPIPYVAVNHELLPPRRRPTRGEVLAREVALVTLVGIAFSSLAAALPAPEPDTTFALVLLLGI